jgi:hypothetical protein
LNQSRPSAVAVPCYLKKGIKININLFPRVITFDKAVFFATDMRTIQFKTEQELSGYPNL